MLDARTAWAIALLLAPTGLAAAGGMAVKAPAQHTAYVEIVVDAEEANPELVTVEARLACADASAVQEAIAWLGDEEGCSVPPGAAIYVTQRQAPEPSPDAMVPTGTVYAYEDADRVWTVREYRFGAASGEQTSYAYVMQADIADRVDEDRPSDPVRGVVDLEKMGIQPGERADLETTLGPAPEQAPTDPTVERVGPAATGSVSDEEALGLTG